MNKSVYNAIHIYEIYIALNPNDVLDFTEDCF